MQPRWMVSLPRMSSRYCSSFSQEDKIHKGLFVQAFGTGLCHSIAVSRFCNLQAATFTMHLASLVIEVDAHFFTFSLVCYWQVDSRSASCTICYWNWGKWVVQDGVRYLGLHFGCQERQLVISVLSGLQHLSQLTCCSHTYRN